MADSVEELNLTKTVLEPDHPLLAQFQQALKQFLLSQINRIKEEILEIEHETNIKKKEVDVIGERSYDAEQLVCSQHEELESLVQEIDDKIKKQQKEEDMLNENKDKLRTIEKKVFETEKYNKQLLHEITSMTQLNKNLSQSESKIESNINLNKRIASKARSNHNSLVRQKQRQDYIIFMLGNEIWKLESEIESHSLQLEVKQNDIAKLEEMVIVENANISAAQAEYRCLLQSWNSAVHAISARSKILDSLNEKQRKLKEHLQSMKGETARVKKLTKKEFEENEKLMELKRRFDYGIKSIRAEIEEETSRRIQLENSMLELKRTDEETERKIEEIRINIQAKQYEIDILDEEYRTYYSMKLNTEKEIEQLLKSKITHVGSTRKSVKRLEDARDKRIEIERLMRGIDNKNGYVMAAAESQSFKNEYLNIYHHELQVQMKSLQQEAVQLRAQKEKLEFKYRRLEKALGMKSKKLQELTIASENRVTNLADMKIIDWTKALEQSKEAVSELEKFWLRDQTNILAVSQDRQEQIHEIDLLKKEVLVLEQKNIRISDQIEEIRSNEKKVEHSIYLLSNKSDALCSAVFKTQNKKTSLRNNTTLLQSQYDSKLKNSELELLVLETDITDIEEEKVALSKELIEANKEQMEWEKQLQTTKDIQNSIKEAKSVGGEMTNLKLQIHKSQVNYSHLRKVQDTLLKDLEYCISRRKTIFCASEAFDVQGNKKDNRDKLRTNFVKKIDDLRNKIKQTQTEVKTTKKEVASMNQRIVRLKKKIDSGHRNQTDIENTKLEITLQLEDARTSRQLKFELLVLKQKQASIYDLIVKHRKPYMIYKTQDDQKNEFAKQKDINNKLLKIVDVLALHFPSTMAQMTRLQNSLGLVAVSLYV